LTIPENFVYYNVPVVSCPVGGAGHPNVQLTWDFVAYSFLNTEQYFPQKDEQKSGWTIFVFNIDSVLLLTGNIYEKE
jgi:hypothetical protein